MKSINSILLCIVALLFTFCNNDVGFTRVVEGRIEDRYRELVLVKNISQNELKQSKVMINYFDSIGLSMNDLLETPEIKHYSMSFYKSTSATRKRFIKNQRVYTINTNRTYLGGVLMGHCKNDSTKWRVIIIRNFGTVDNLGAVTKRGYLQNDCDPNWYEANKNNELVRYYMELRRRRGESGRL